MFRDRSTDLSLPQNFLAIVKDLAEKRAEDHNAVRATVQSIREAMNGRGEGDIKETPFQMFITNNGPTVSWTNYTALFCAVVARLRGRFAVQIAPSPDMTHVRIIDWQGVKPAVPGKYWFSLEDAKIKLRTKPEDLERPAVSLSTCEMVSAHPESYRVSSSHVSSHSSTASPTSWAVRSTMPRRTPLHAPASRSNSHATANSSSPRSFLRETSM